MEQLLDARAALRELYRINARLLELESAHLARDWTEIEQQDFDQLNQRNEHLRDSLRQPLNAAFKGP